MAVPFVGMYDPATPLLHPDRRRTSVFPWALTATFGIVAAVLFCMLVSAQVEVLRLKNDITRRNVAPEQSVSSQPAVISSNGRSKPKRGLMTSETRQKWMPVMSEFMVGNMPKLPSWERLKEEDLPTAWDWRNVNGKNYLSPSKQQHLPHYCGGCWAFASVQALNDRINIALNASQPAISLAHQVLFNCQDCGNCEEGGESYCVFGFAHKYGMPDDTCQVYEARTGVECLSEGKHGFSNCNPECICKNTEWDMKTHYAVTVYRKWYVQHYGHLPTYDIHAMKAEIYAHGPIVCGMFVSEGFYWNYTKGVWAEKGEFEVDQFDHAIAVSGWGVDEDTNTEYWLVRNTWGSYFGEQGWFKVPIHGDNLGVGLQCDFATIDLERSVPVPETPLGKYWDYERHPVHGRV